MIHLFIKKNMIMKKILFVSVALIFALIGNCQSLSFNGIPIEGRESAFNLNLIRQGFSPVQISPEVIYSGEFEGEKCFVKPVAFENGDIQGVLVVLESDNDWMSLFMKYKILKLKLSREYGKAEIVQERFNTTYEPNTNEQKFAAVIEGKCDYYSQWLIGSGGVLLSIAHLPTGGNAVTVSIAKFAGDLAENNSSQQSNSHIKFKGVLLGGSLDVFLSEMKKQGFSYVEQKSQEDCIILSGAFAGYSDCKLFVFYSLPYKIVANVAVNFPDQIKWDHLYSQYSKLKILLTEKYGSPSSCIEEFDSSREISSNYEKMFYLEQDRCNFETVYFVEGGYIKLLISHLNFEGIHHSYVSLIYVDFETYSNKEKKAIDDL